MSEQEFALPGEPTTAMPGATSTWPGPLFDPKAYSLAPDSFSNQCSKGLASSPCNEQFLMGQDGDYRIRVPTYQTTALTVLDEVTGLIWQRTPAAMEFDSRDAAIAHCASLSLDGHTDWRLPSRLEHVTIFDVVGNVWDPASSCLPPVLALAEKVQATNAVPFQPCFWTQSGTMACGCSIYGEDVEPSAYARCVRGAPAPAALSLSPGGQMVFDARTGLIWQRQGSFGPKSALATCEGLTLGGWSDWRLPSVKELSSLVDESFADGLDPAIFPGNQAGLYQSSSLTISDAVVLGTGVYFSADTSMLLSGRGHTAPNFWGGLWVRCVRN